jgi:hypothetical protein
VRRNAAKCSSSAPISAGSALVFSRGGRANALQASGVFSSGVLLSFVFEIELWSVVLLSWVFEIVAVIRSSTCLRT